MCYLELSEVDEEGDDEAEGGWVWLCVIWSCRK